MLDFIVDLRKAAAKAPLIWYMALSETKARYKRSILGPLWLTVGCAVGVVGLGLVWSSLLNQSMSDFIPPLTVGLLLWQLISTTVIESSAVFSRQAQIIRNVPLPFLIYPAQLVIRQLITFFHNLVVLVVVFLIYPPPLTFGILWSIVGLFLVVLNLLWIALAIGMLGARFRDIEQIIPAVMPLIFFLTPVIYRSSHLGANQAIIWLNPFTYFLAVVRDPLFGVIPDAKVYIVFGLITLVGWVFAIALFSSRKSRIPYWV